MNDWKQLEEKNYYIKVRSRDSLHLCKIKIIEEEKFEVQVLNDKVRAVTPGQGIVIYDEDSKIIASGIIIINKSNPPCGLCLFISLLTDTLYHISNVDPNILSKEQHNPHCCVKSNDNCDL